MAQEEIRHIVRIANTDLKGHKETYVALNGIKGVSFAFTNAICKVAKIDPRKKVGLLTDDELRRIMDILKDPIAFNIPTWMLNKQREYETGLDRHFIAVDMELAKEEDLKRLKKIKCYRGIRHTLRAPVRGQRTRSNFRANKGKVVGVKKNKDAKAGRT